MVLHAPNVHGGGGYALLQELIGNVGGSLRVAHLDKRLGSRLELSPGVDLYMVERSVAGRLKAEWRLWRTCQRSDVVLCFHGLPPLFPLPGKVVVFVQNRLLVGSPSLRGFPFPVAIRIRVERLWCWLLRRRVDEYVVQTPSMARDLSDWHIGAPIVRVLAFAPRRMASAAPKSDAIYDFVYVASSEAHKNHGRLIDAWQVLAGSGLFPSLALTIGPEDRAVRERIRRLTEQYPVRIHDLGIMGRDQLLAVYGQCGALVYPSLGESFGLPLLEAAAAGLPIIASERDYVRDVVTPTETFDPESAVSIARAVRRFLGKPEAPFPIATAEDFLEQILRT